MKKLDITTVILTYNEELHIRRCLENVCGFSRRVIVVDSPSTDRTVEICNEFENVEVVVHQYPGNQAAQFNWALDNLKIDTEWVLRMDADEYLLPELVDELQRRIPSMPLDITGIEFKRRHIFMDKWVKHGIYPVIILRMFRNGVGRYDNRLMDEHIVLMKGKSMVFEHDFCDHSLIPIDDYCRKHINYASREAWEVLSGVYDLSNHIDSSHSLGEQAQSKHQKKDRYNKLPLFWRSFSYFLFRYIIKLGFLDGKAGFAFAFFQGWWYRTLVDAKIYEARKWLGANGFDYRNLSAEGKAALKGFIRDSWGISVD